MEFTKLVICQQVRHDPSQARSTKLSETARLILRRIKSIEENITQTHSIIRKSSCKIPWSASCLFTNNHTTRAKHSCSRRNCGEEEGLLSGQVSFPHLKTIETMDLAGDGLHIEPYRRCWTSTISRRLTRKRAAVSNQGRSL